MELNNIFVSYILGIFLFFYATRGTVYIMFKEIIVRFQIGLL